MLSSVQDSLAVSEVSFYAGALPQQVLRVRDLVTGRVVDGTSPLAERLPRGLERGGLSTHWGSEGSRSQPSFPSLSSPCCL